MIYKSNWKVIFIKIFASKKGFGFVIEYAWISKLLRARHLHDGREAVILIRLKKVSYFEEYCYLNSTCITESIGLMFMNSSRDKFSLSFQSSVTDIFLLISVCHVGAHPDGHQHGVSIQISINLGKTFFPDISYTKNCTGLNLGDGLCIFKSFHFPDSGLYLLNGFDFYFGLFWVAWHWKPAIRDRFSACKWGPTYQSRRGTICYILNENVSKICLGNKNLTASRIHPFSHLDRVVQSLVNIIQN